MFFYIQIGSLFYIFLLITVFLDLYKIFIEPELSVTHVNQNYLEICFYAWMFKNSRVPIYYITYSKILILHC